MLSSRNNNFSNRGQKLVIHSNPIENGINITNLEVVEPQESRSTANNTVFHIVVVSIIVSIIFIGSYLYGKKQGDNYWGKQLTNCRRSCSNKV